MNVLQVRVILRACVGCGAHKVAEVAEHVSGHHRVQINDAHRLACFVEHDIVHLRVAVVDTFGQFALAEQAFSQAHLFAAAVDGIYYIHAGGFSALDIRSQGFVQLLQTELNVVEVWYRLAQFVKRQVGQLALESSERLACQIGGLGSDAFLRGGALDKHIYAPVISHGSTVV